MLARSLGALLAVFLLGATFPGLAFAQDDPDLDGAPGLAEPPDEPFAPVPSILVGTGNLLIDRSHGNSFNVSGFMNYLASQGWIIAEHQSGAIDESALAGFDVLLIPTRNDVTSILPFSAAEVAAIQVFLDDGHGLWVLDDNGNSSGVNTLANAFGVHFYGDYIQDFTNNEGQSFWPTIHLIESHPVTMVVETYGYYLGCCLVANSPSQVIAQADDDAYSFYCEAGSRPPVLAVFENGGRVVLAGDITPLHPTYYPSRLRPEEQLLLQNIVNWLLGEPPTAASAASWGSIKALHVVE